jgi:o-succinylbenzoate synthase
MAWATYLLPLRMPTTADGAAERRGLILSLDGALGEAAPLPGLHDEDLDFLVSLLSQQSLLADFPVCDDVRTLLWQLNSRKSFVSLPPSLRFGLESALVQRFADQQSASLVRVLWPDGSVELPRSVGLFSGSAAAAEAALAANEFAPYAGVKIKIGRTTLDQDLRTVETFRSHWPEAELRLDANRSFDRATMRRLSDAVENLEIAFVEEPFADPHDLDAWLADAAGLPVALDESLVSAIRAGELPPAGPAVAAWVVKPACIGIPATLRLMAEAQDTPVIISSAFESDVGLRMLRALACGSSAAPGLGTDRWFYGPLAAEHLEPWRQPSEDGS